MDIYVYHIHAEQQQEVPVSYPGYIHFFQWVWSTWVYGTFAEIERIVSQLDNVRHLNLLL